MIGNSTSRAATLASIAAGDNQLSLAGPKASGGGTFSAVVSLPIFLPVANASNSWDFTAVNPLCSTACIDAATQNRFWGFSIGVIDFSATHAGTDPRLSKMQADGFLYRLIDATGQASLALSLLAPSTRARPRAPSPAHSQSFICSPHAVDFGLRDGTC